jgi:hypothetical protein
MVHESKKLAPELEKVMRDVEPQKLKTILGKNFSWFNFYELPFNEHIALLVLILNWQDDIKRAAQSDDPQQYAIDFFNKLDPDEDWQGGFQGMFEMRDLVGLVISI